MWYKILFVLLFLVEALWLMLAVSPVYSDSVDSVMVELPQYFKVLKVQEIHQHVKNKSQWMILCFIGDIDHCSLLVKQNVSTGICEVESIRSFAKNHEYLGTAKKVDFKNNHNKKVWVL